MHRILELHRLALLPLTRSRGLAADPEMGDRRPVTGRRLAMPDLEAAATRRDHGPDDSCLSDRRRAGADGRADDGGLRDGRRARPGDRTDDCDLGDGAPDDADPSATWS
jgi:hypothetical protein